MWPKNEELPDFGCLRGVKVINHCQSLAGPFVGDILAEYGADVIWIESAGAPDISRTTGRYQIENDRRNMRNLALSIKSEAGRKIFLDLVADADVLIEAHRGDQYVKWGLSDEGLWELNPRLVICHVSGFGTTGLPEYVGRASYDFVAQAFSGYMYANMNPVTPPYTVGPYIGDYATGLFGVIGTLAALYRARETGVGESVDVAQYEAMMRIQEDVPDQMAGRPADQAGMAKLAVGTEAYLCKDGYVQMAIGGAATLKRVLPFLGLEYGSELFPDGSGMVRNGTPGGDVLFKTLTDWCAERTTDEAVEQMDAVGVAATKVNTIKDLAENPHVQARGTLIEMDALKGPVTVVDAVPKFKNNPNKLWRAAPYQGMDNEVILKEMGYTDDQIAALYDEKTIGNDAEMRWVYPYDA